MERMTGTVVRGIRTPIINCGDDLIQIVSDSIIKASQIEGFPIRDRDIAAITESVVARAQGNYADIDAIAADVRSKFGDVTLGVVFPILSWSKRGR
jgi:F420-0:gamma-glutamyl ligase